MTFRSDAVIGNRERVMHYLTPMREEFSLHVDLKSHKFPAALVMLIERTWDTWVNKNSTVEASIAQLQRALFVLSQRTPCRPDCCAARLHTGEKGGGAEGLYDRHRQGPTVMAQGLYVDGRCGQTKPMQTLRDGRPGKAEAPPAVRCCPGAASRLGPGCRRQTRPDETDAEGQRWLAGQSRGAAGNALSFRRIIKAHLGVSMRLRAEDHLWRLHLDQ